MYVGIPNRPAAIECCVAHVLIARVHRPAGLIGEDKSMSTSQGERWTGVGSICRGH